MDTYAELRAVLLLAQRIGQTCPDLLVQLAQVGQAGEQIPRRFVEIIQDREEVPSASVLEEMRPKPHGAFDTILLRRFCMDALSARFCPEGHELVVQLKIWPV